MGRRGARTHTRLLPVIREDGACSRFPAPFTANVRVPFPCVGPCPAAVRGLLHPLQISCLKCSLQTRRTEALGLQPRSQLPKWQGGDGEGMQQRLQAAFQPQPRLRRTALPGGPEGTASGLVRALPSARRGRADAAGVLGMDSVGGLVSGWGRRWN